MEQNYINRFSKIVKSVDVDIIKDVYVKDYELIDSVKFVNKVDNGNIN